MAAFELRPDELDRELDDVSRPSSLRLHPGLSEIYRRKVAQLEEALNDESIKAEAAEVLRGLIDQIELSPHDDGPGMEAPPLR